MKKEYTVLQYNNYKKFSCIGDKCKYSCCKYWDIDIDSETYKKYQISTFFTKEMLESKFTKNQSGDIKFRLKKDGDCPLHNENGLCDIHSNLGEKFLCKTCRVYPRAVNLIDNTLEKSLYTSCPEVVNKILIENKIIEFDSVLSYEDKDELNIVKKVDTRKNNYLKYFWDIRIFTISILQNREIDLEKRLILLGLVYKKLENVIKNNEEDKIPMILNLYKEEFDKKDILSNIDELNIDNKIKLNIIKKLILDSYNHKEFEVIIKNLKKELCFDDEELMINKYKEVIDGKYKKYLDKYSYTLENYLVNLVYSSAMPSSIEGNIFDEYLKLVVQYSIIKIYLVGTDEEEITLDRFIDVVSLGSRAMNHNKVYLENVNKYLKSITSDSMNTLAMLVILMK